MWAIAVWTAPMRERFATEREAWTFHDSLVIKGLNPDSLAVIQLRAKESR